MTLVEIDRVAPNAGRLGRSPASRDRGKWIAPIALHVNAARSWAASPTAWDVIAERSPFGIHLGVQPRFG